jgi:hypothetical protein
MRLQKRAPQWAAALVAALTGVVQVSPAVAQEACIICSGPEKVYVCSVEKSDKVQRLGIADKAVQFVCVTEMAKLGGHDKCAVRRDVDLTTCTGQPQTVSLASLLEATAEQAKPVVPAISQAAPAIVATPSPAKPPPGSSPPDAPKTMVELARRANEQSAATTKKVGGAVQKTWDCMISLFQRC